MCAHFQQLKYGVLFPIFLGLYVHCIKIHTACSIARLENVDCVESVL